MGYDNAGAPAGQVERGAGDIALEFLNWLDPNGTHALAAISPQGGPPEAATFPPARRDEIPAWVDARDGRLNLYYSVNEPRADLGSNKAKKADITRLRAVFADLDPRPGYDLAAERARIEAAMETSPVPFGAIVDSGGGYQGLALLDEKVAATPGAQRWIEEHGRGLAAALGGDAVQNIDRVLRLPGSMNIPGEAKRAKGRVERPARIVKHTGARITRDDIARHVTPLAAPVTREGEGAAIAEAILDVEHSGFDAAYRYDELPDDLRARFENDLTQDSALARLWQDGEINGPDKSGSALRFKLAGRLKHLGGYASEDYAALAWVWDRTGLQSKGTRDDVVRQLGRDWGRADATNASPDCSSWFSPVPIEVFETIFDQAAQTGGALDRLDRDHRIFRPSRFTPRNPATIPPRQWLYGKHLIRGFVSLTVAPGGLGKSSLLTSEMLAMSTGKPLLGVAPPEPLRVWSWNGEDPLGELDRRFTAACLHFNITAEDIGDRLMIDSGRDLPISIASLGPNGLKIAAPLVDALIAAIRDAKIDVLVVDPFVSSHEVPENENGALNAVVAEWRRIADVTGCAIELVHHANKAAAMDTDAAGIYGSRGAGALIDAVRSARFLSRMKKDDAARLGLETHERYFRVETGKINMAPVGNAVWRQMIGVPLNNGAGHWPKGDVVGVCAPWAPPEAMDGITDTEVQAALAAISARPDPALAEEQANDWAGYVIARALHMDVGEGLKKDERSAGQNAARAKVRGLLKQWREQGHLEIRKQHCGRRGREVSLVTLAKPVPAADEGMFG